ncbi:winged helix-turn-helix domain-containing protein [Planctobacterium marinum]|uniref:OmpR/PhoB-type domain-containing protein n=1 Tax=Planctobacterium marinum TaxID=1631968 RepID=A0AA48HTE5_9ALTE|nr:hypothetical protein MACH26_38880 [Planctobacterium marinum]
MTANSLQLNQWHIQLDSGELTLIGNELYEQENSDRLEPKALQLLIVLARQPNKVMSKDELFALLWPGQVVTDDALTRCVSKLRKALRDDPKSAEIIETIPRRGYRLIAENVIWLPNNEGTEQLAPLRKRVSRAELMWTMFAFNRLIFGCVVFLLIFFWFYHSDTQFLKKQPETSYSDVQPLLRQADDYYSQIRRQDNEMAIELYQQIMTLRPDIGAGQAGLANALVQQVLRWPNPANEVAINTQNLQQALQAGLTESEQAQQKLHRALALAQNAVTQTPDSARAYKALGFVYSALQEFDLALQSYERAIELDENAWDALINYGDVLEIKGNLSGAMGYYTRAFEAMQKVRVAQSARVNPWLADFGAHIASKYSSMGRLQEAEIWYRKVLNFAPFNSNATKGLVEILKSAGDDIAAQRLCLEYLQRIGNDICII